MDKNIKIQKDLVNRCASLIEINVLQFSIKLTVLVGTQRYGFTVVSLKKKLHKF